MEQFPGYNYNSGLGAGLDTNSVALGQTLVDSMIEEVTQMCNQQAWASKVYQQVCMCCNIKILWLHYPSESSSLAGPS